MTGSQSLLALPRFRATSISTESSTAENAFIKTCSYACQREILEGNIYFFSLQVICHLQKKLQTMHPFSAVSN